MSNFLLTNETRFQSLPYVTASRLLSIYSTFNHWDTSLVVVNDEMTDLRASHPDGICYVQLNLTTSSISQLDEIDQDICANQLPQNPLHISVTIGYGDSCLGDIMVNVRSEGDPYNGGTQVNFDDVLMSTDAHTITERIMVEIADRILVSAGFDRSDDPLGLCNMDVIS